MHPVPCEQIGSLPGQSVIEQAARGQIDGHGQGDSGVQPGLGLGGSGFQHVGGQGADQQLVAVVVTEGVVDLPEPVQVDEQQSDCRAGALSRSGLLAETVKEQHAVRQTGQGIVKRVAQRLTPFTVQ
ncbi:hypothetical protein BJQ89_03497 [Arthrobacter sp. ES1]|nr:hypothetical protein [Arthrobacter sp. ES1]